MTRDPDSLQVAVRAYAPPPPRYPRKSTETAASQTPPKSVRMDYSRHPQRLLVLDTETTVDAAQALLFGCYRFYRVRWLNGRPELTCVEEGLWHDDGLPARDPDGYELLVHYASSTASAVAEQVRDARRELRLLSRDRFIADVYLPALDARATVVGFNLPFDLARIALDWGIATKWGFEGGFSFLLGRYQDEEGLWRIDGSVPRQIARALDANRAMLTLGGVRRKSDPYAHIRGGGSFLDLRTLVSTLGDGTRHSLESACHVSGVPYRKRHVELGRLSRDLIDYCRGDVAATADLYPPLAAEYERWGLNQSPQRAYSGASLAKAALREAGLAPILKRQPDFPAEVMGAGMTAYYGGRSEVRIRRHPVPVSTLDFSSMHPTVAVLQQLSTFLTCQRVEVIKEPAERVARWQRFLDTLTVGDCLDRKLWPKLNAFVLVQPQGHIMPLRARYEPGGPYSTGFGPSWSEEPVWITLADALASRLLSGRPLRLLAMIRLSPRGTLQGLGRVRIRGSRPIDPLQQDLFKALVEQRRVFEQNLDAESLRTAAALKVVASSASYGIWAQLNRREPTDEPIGLNVYGLSEFFTGVRAPEDLGEYFFGPLAALVTGGARLMLALLERMLTDAGGSWATADTDAMAAVATRKGGLVPCPGGPYRNEKGEECVLALSWQQLDAIIDRFIALNPYDPRISPGSILRLEPENHTAEGERRELQCYAISAKRYALYTLDEVGAVQLVKRSEHALGGVYLNPLDPDSDARDWVEEIWTLIINQDALGRDYPAPPWLDLPALTRFTASHPRLLESFAYYNEQLEYREQVKPFGFLLVAHVSPGGHPPGADPERFALLAPPEANPRRWTELDWRNVHDPPGRSYRLDISSIFERRGHALPTNTVAVMTYGDVLNAYRRRPEYKSAAMDGSPCSRGTTGLLQRRSVRAITPIEHIGKEANLLDQIAAGITTTDDETTSYRDQARDDWDEAFLPMLRRENVREVASALDVDPSTITRLRKGSRPRLALRIALERELGRRARDLLRSQGIVPPFDDAGSCRLLIERLRKGVLSCG